MSLSSQQGTPRDETDRGYAFIEVVLPPRAPFVGEPFVLRLRAGVDGDVLESNLVQLFRQRLDVPVQLDHPWFEGPRPNSAPGGVNAIGPPRAAGASTPDLAPEEPTEDRALARVALGAEILPTARHIERGADGRRFSVFEFERTYSADAAGVHAIPAPRLGFAYALEFRDDLVAGRVPVDRRDAFVLGASQSLTVRALPEAGRPFSFHGAIGRFSLEARVSATDIALDETTLLSVTVTAAGELGEFATLRVDRVPGFTVRGTRETTVGRARTIECELAPMGAGTLVIRPLEFAYFDPEREAYIELATAPFTVNVAAGAASAPAPVSMGGIPPPRSTFRVSFSMLIIGVGVLALVLVLIVLGSARRGA